MSIKDFFEQVYQIGDEEKPRIGTKIKGLVSKYDVITQYGNRGLALKQARQTWQRFPIRRMNMNGLF